MAYLNLKAANVGLEVEPAKMSHRPQLNEAKSVVKYVLPNAELTQWLEKLSAVWGEGSEAGELRVDLPQNWIVFCKTRPQGTRLLIAHPERGEWVATLSIEAKLAPVLFRALQNFTQSADREFDLNQFLAEHTRIDNVTNVVVKIRRAV